MMPWGVSVHVVLLGLAKVCLTGAPAWSRTPRMGGKGSWLRFKCRAKVPQKIKGKSRGKMNTFPIVRHSKLIHLKGLFMQSARMETGSHYACVLKIIKRFLFCSRCLYSSLYCCARFRRKDRRQKTNWSYFYESECSPQTVCASSSARAFAGRGESRRLGGCLGLI